MQRNTQIKSKPKFPFQVDALDHCESPLQSYKDIDVFLKFYAKSIGKSKSTISIYDPYFCSGSIKRNLAKLGYSKVYNKCEDFYEKIENPPSCIANSAVYILKRTFLLVLKKTYSNHKYPLSFSDDIIPNYLGKIYWYLTSSSVVDIGTPDRYNAVK